MRHKYLITIAKDQQELLISEQAEVDRDIFMPLCEETFSLAELREAAADGEASLVASLRSDNFYPPLENATQIAVIVTEMLKSEDPERRELLIDDRQVMAEAEAAEAAAAAAAVKALPSDDEDLDDLLEDDAAPPIPVNSDESSGEKEDN